MKIIGILGNAGCGKDTVGEMILTRLRGKALALAQPLKEFAGVVYGFNAEQLWGPSEKRNAFDPTYDKTNPGIARNWSLAMKQFENYAPYWLRRILPGNMDCDKVLAILREWFYTTQKTDQLSPRYILQTLGTEFGRSVYPDTWIDYGINQAHKYLNDGLDVVVITDVRFLNEAKEIREQNGEIWHLVRFEDKGAAAQQAGVQGHASEMEQLKPEMKQYVTETIYNTRTLEALRVLVERLILGLRVKWNIPFT